MLEFAITLIAQCRTRVCPPRQRQCANNDTTRMFMLIRYCAEMFFVYARYASLRARRPTQRLPPARSRRALRTAVPPRDHAVHALHLRAMTYPALIVRPARQRDKRRMARARRRAAARVLPPRRSTYRQR